MSAETLYHNNLQNAKAPGLGCHIWIMSTANLGTFAGLSGDKIFSDIRRSIPVGNRKVSDHEITEAINKALSEHRDGNFCQQPRPASPIRDGKAALQRIITQSTISNEVDLWEMSPIRLWDGP